MEDDIDLGPCCACGGVKCVRNIIMLNVKGTEPGHGWGCATCGLPCDGAVAVLCNECFDSGLQPRFAVDGYMTEKKRIPIKQLTETYVHDMKKHFAMRMN